jgi:hypothetical protein
MQASKRGGYFLHLQLLTSLADVDLAAELRSYDLGFFDGLQSENGLNCANGLVRRVLTFQSGRRINLPHDVTNSCLRYVTGLCASSLWSISLAEDIRSVRATPST